MAQHAEVPGDPQNPSLLGVGTLSFLQRTPTHDGVSLARAKDQTTQTIHTYQVPQLPLEVNNHEKFLQLQQESWKSVLLK